jgi:hypothetical protein
VLIRILGLSVLVHGIPAILSGLVSCFPGRWSEWLLLELCLVVSFVIGGFDGHWDFPCGQEPGGRGIFV